MPEFTQKKFKPLRIFAFFLRALSQLLSVWPLILLALFFLFPNGPHLRVYYAYELRGSEKIMFDCQYLGARGLVRYRHGYNCPVIVMIDRREAFSTHD